MTRPRIFLDLDGVLVDWHAGAAKLHGISLPVFGEPYPLEVNDFTDLTPEQFYAGMDRNFWAELPPLPHARTLVDMAEDYFGADVAILTKPILTEGCSDGKRAWVAEHLGSQYLRKVFIASDKHFCASPLSLLIDDKSKTCDEFVDYGGHAYLFPASWNERCGTNWDTVRAELHEVFGELSKYRRVRDGVTQGLGKEVWRGKEISLPHTVRHTEAED